MEPKVSKRITLFNHKGGTGKTVSAYHLGWKLTEEGSKVLLVDGDSQVNLTALSLGFDRFDEYYESDSTKNKNIKDGISPVLEGKPAALEAFDCPTAANNNSLFVLPGHADLSSYEGQISLAQETGGSLSVMKNIPGAIHALISMIEEHHNIDYTVIDLNPGLGAINQNFFMASDAFIVPTNPDPFSLMAINTLGNYLAKWNEWKNSNYHKFADADYPLYQSTPTFIGTLNSRFNKHASKAAKKFDQRIKQIDERVSENLFPLLRDAGMTASDDRYHEAFEAYKGSLSTDNTGIYALARIPDFQSLIHTATRSEVPIFELNEDHLRNDDIFGATKDNAVTNIAQFNEIYTAIAQKTKFLSNAQ